MTYYKNNEFKNNDYKNNEFINEMLTHYYYYTDTALKD